MNKVGPREYQKYCFFCGSPEINGEHHLIFGGPNRGKAEEDGLKVTICDRCHTLGAKTEKIHDNEMAEKLSKMLGQAIYERNLLAEGEVRSIAEARKQFQRRYGRAYY